MAAAIDGVAVLMNATWTFFPEYVGTIRTYAVLAGPDMNWVVSLCDLIDYARARLVGDQDSTKNSA